MYEVTVLSGLGFDLSIQHAQTVDVSGNRIKIDDGGNLLVFKDSLVVAAFSSSAWQYVTETE